METILSKQWQRRKRSEFKREKNAYRPHTINGENLYTLLLLNQQFPLFCWVHCAPCVCVYGWVYRATKTIGYNALCFNTRQAKKEGSTKNSALVLYGCVLWAYNGWKLSFNCKLANRTKSTNIYLSECQRQSQKRWKEKR